MSVRSYLKLLLIYQILISFVLSHVRFRQGLHKFIFQRDKKIEPFYEQGTSKKRIAQYLAWWLWWVSLIPALALGEAAVDSGGDTSGGYTVFGLTVSGDVISTNSVEDDGSLVDSDSASVNNSIPIAIYMPDEDPVSGTNPVRVYSWAENSDNSPIPPDVTCPNSVAVVPQSFSTVVMLNDGDQCTLTVTPQSLGYPYSHIRYSGTLSRTGNIHSLTNGRVCGAPYTPCVPEINLVGNSNNISDGDTTPSTTDNTDFGSTPTSTPVDKTFSIENTGEIDLILSGSPIVALTGADCSMFSVTSQPTSPIASSASDNFTIRYNPTAAATHNCTVSIANDDTNENPYDFAITGVGDKTDQTITFSPPATGAVGGSTTLSATADSGLTVSFASTTTSVCTVSGTTLSFIDAGTCTVTADQAGDGNYNAASQVSENIEAYTALENVTQISGGGFHTCALANSGVKCWGGNDSGQLGDNSTTDRSTPVDVNGLTSSVSAISVGYKHSCALLDTNGVKCWGWNSYGQLGDNSTIDRSTPVDVNGLTSGVSAIAAGGSHTCALLDTGGVKCWGYNFGGQLGDNSTTTSSVPVDVDGLSNGVSMISLGGSYSCALLDTGGAKCWGVNGYGQVGDGSTTNRLTPVDVSGLTSGVSTIISGNTNGCALLDTSGLKCWGRNANGQVGDNSTTERHTPVDVSGLTSGVSAVALGQDHGCALPDTGGAKCWGLNSSGQLGDNSTTDRHTPVDVSGLSSGISAITLGFNHSCVLLDTNKVQCWGSNSNGQLGDNSTIDSSVPIHVKVLLPEINLVGNGNNIADGDTTPTTTDDTDFGNTPVNTPVDKTFTIQNIGYADLTLSGDPEVVLTGADCGMFSVTSQPTSPIASSASDSFTVRYNPTAAATHNCTVSIANDDTNENPHTFAITGVGDKIDQTITFSPPATGALGGSTTLSATADSGLTVSFASTTTSVCTVSGTTLNFIAEGTCTVTADQAGDSNYNAASQVSENIDAYAALENVTQVSGGNSHTCALVNGGVKCWGWNFDGQLGNNSLTDSHTPVDVNGLASGVSAIAVGYGHSCALLDTGGIKCWGSNGNGQLGNNSTTDSRVPVDVDGLTSGVSALAVGNSHACVQLDTGGIKCWGNNNYGQLGDNSTTNRSVPVDVNGLSSGVSMIGLGDGHSCAVLDTGGIKCWGYNSEGRVGDGSDIDRHTPVDVSGLASGVSTVASSSHTCVLLDTGGVKCWGGNFYGQLGDNSTTTSYTPIDVSGLSSGVSAIAVGGLHTCALLDTGEVKCWGDNGYGQLGDNSTTERHTPVDVTGLTSGISAITLGYEHSCALLDTGRVQCWGGNIYGRLGNNSVAMSFVPVHVKVILPAEINIVGNSNNISDGDTTPDTTDDTDFGETEPNATINKTFTIENTGTGVLSLSGSPIVDLTGADCGVFSVTSEPSASISAGSSSNFTVSYTPTAIGTHDCSVTIDNDDSDENPYDFAITGTSVALAAPSFLSGDFLTAYITLSWGDNSSNEDEFLLSRDGTLLTSLSANSFSYVDFDVTCGTTYTYAIKASNATDESTTVSTTVDTNTSDCTNSEEPTTSEPTVPNAPINFTASPISYDQIQLTWGDDSAIETGYKIERNGVLTATLAENTETYTSENLSCETAYSYDLYAYNSIGDSEHLTSTATTLTCPPNTPSNLSATVTADSIILSWEDVEGETSYLVTRELLTSRRLRAVVEFDLAADSTTFTDSDFECGRSYTYAVAAVADTSASEAATIDVDAEPCAGAPIAPNLLDTSSITDNSISLTWSDNSDNETGFYVFNNGSLTAELSENAESATIRNLQCETSYSLQVSAYNAQGQTNSESISVTTDTCPLVNLVAPSNFIATALHNQVQLTWHDNSVNETGFPIARNGEFITITAINAESFTDTNLTCGTEYFYQLYATDGDINVGGLEQTITTPECLPEGSFYIHLNSAGSGIINNCSATACSLSATAGTTINLSVTPNEGWQFSHWSGDCTSSQLLVDAEKNCVANFTPIFADSEQAIIVNPLDPTIPRNAEPIPYVGSHLCNNAFTNFNSTSGDLTICESATVSGGVLTGDNINEGIVASIELAENATITGGRISGFNTNYGTLRDVTITQYSEVTGGFYAGAVDNNGTIIDSYITENSVIYSSTRQGTIAGITQNKGTIQGTIKLGVNTVIIGGTLSGSISAPIGSPAYIGAAEILPGSTLQNVYISPTVKLPRDVTLINVKRAPNPAEPSLDDFGINMTQLDDLNARTIVAIEPAAMALFDRYEIAEVPSEAFAGMTPEQTAALEPETASSISVEQFEQLPPEALAGFTSDNIMALSPEVMQSLTPTQLESFDLDAIQQAELIAKLLTNLDPETPPAIINKILPQGWQITPVGKIIPPVGARLSFRALSKRLVNSILTPYLIDFETSLTLGGKIVVSENGANSSVGQGFNLGLQQTPSIDTVDLSQFIFTQNEYGIFNVVGTGDYEGIVFAFMPNANNIEQAPLETPVGLTVLEGGYFEMITPDKQKFILINAPNNPVGLQQALGGDSEVKLSPTGDVLMRIDAANTRSRNIRFETDVIMVCTFDSFVEPAPDGFCENVDLCDFGMEFPSDFGQLRAEQEARVVYPDGSAQTMYPTVIYPQTLVNLLEQYEAVSKVLYKADGTFEVTTLVNGQAQKYHLTSNINIELQKLDAGEKRNPTVSLKGNTLFYEVQEGNDLLTFSLSIELS